MPTTAPPPSVIPPVPKLPPVLEHVVNFRPTCFYGSAFPACEFANPAAAREFFGPYQLKVTFYNAQKEIVRSAPTVGRYAAVVEIHSNRRTTRRFVTLCRLAGAVDGPYSAIEDRLAAGGVGDDLLAQRRSELTLGPPDRHAAPIELENVEAIWAASLFDLAALGAQAQTRADDTLVQLDKQWWVEFKRHFYGLDKVYTRPFISPVRTSGRPSPVVREGTLEEAGFSATGRRGVDATGAAWVAATGIGFAACVVRHGVIGVHQAWGNISSGPDQGKPFAIDTVARLASTTKFLSAIMMAQFVDQGLVDLDEPAAKYVPALEGLSVEHPPTVRDLYLHTAGFRGHWGDTLNDLEEIIADIYPTLRSQAPHQYQGIGHALGGKIMETIAGQTMGRLYRRHLVGPLECTHSRFEQTSYGSYSIAAELARIGQMMLNGGAYGEMRFLSPATVRKMLPIPGRDRFEPEPEIRWGVGIKLPDIFHLSDQAYGGSGASGCFLYVDPKLDMVIAVTRFDEGPPGTNHDEFRQHKAAFIKAITAALDS